MIEKLNYIQTRGTVTLQSPTGTYASIFYGADTNQLNQDKINELIDVVNELKMRPQQTVGSDNESVKYAWEIVKENNRLTSELLKILREVYEKRQK